MHVGIPALALMLLVSAGVALAEPVKTSKERLSDKASDDQRVDDCRVPVERRSATTRRADCPDKPERPAPIGSGTPAPR